MRLQEVLVWLLSLFLISSIATFVVDFLRNNGRFRFVMPRPIKIRFTGFLIDGPS
jgi:hypothetical protein